MTRRSSNGTASAVAIPPHVFTLYVADIKPASRRAVINLRSFCNDHLPGRCQVQVVDIGEFPQVAREENIVAVPTLIKSWPLPRQIFVGDLSDTAMLLSRLNLDAT